MEELSPHVSVIVLNYNGLQDTVSCLESVLSMDYENYSLVVVDNNSHGGQAEEIDRCLGALIPQRRERPDLDSDNWRAIEFFPLETQSRPGPAAFLLAGTRNLGFCGGNNCAIEFALAHFASEYVLTLNNDVVVEPALLSRLVAFAEADANVGSVQPRILSRDKKETIDSLGQIIFRNGRARDKGQGDRDPGDIGKQEAFGVCAAVGLYRSIALAETGLFDERFFVSLEDVDLAWRLRMCGYSSYCITSAIVYHGRGITGKKGLKDGVNLVRSYNKNKNHLFLMLKYFPARLLFRYAHLNLYRFLAAFAAGVLLGKNILALLPGVWKDRKYFRLTYPGRAQIWKEWLQGDARAQT